MHTILWLAAWGFSAAFFFSIVWLIAWGYVFFLQRDDPRRIGYPALATMLLGLSVVVCLKLSEATWF